MIRIKLDDETVLQVYQPGEREPGFWFFTLSVNSQEPEFAGIALAELPPREIASKPKSHLPANLLSNWDKIAAQIVSIVDEYNSQLLADGLPIIPANHRTMRTMGRGM